MLIVKLTRSICLLAVLAAIVLSGCGGGSAPNNQPSYADLVVTYNAELETLERLERQRGELVSEFERQLMPSTEDAVKALSDVLGAAAGGNRPDSGEPLTPDRALDLAVESAERTGQATTQLLEAATQASQTPDAELTPEQVQLKETFEKELAALDEQIEEQKARVERARQARDAAEAR
jgi:hypothetical protein